MTAKREYWTHGMAKGMTMLPVSVMIKVRPRIVRRGPPQVGSLFFDAESKLIYIVSGAYSIDGRLSNHWHWRRVFTDGTLSSKEYSGYWQWGNVGDKGFRERGARPTPAQR